MNLRLRLLALYTPDWLQRYMLRELFQSTAAAFGCPPPPPDGRAPATLLAQYARFTQSMAEAALEGDHSALPDLETRLYREAYALGARLRRLCGVTTRQDVMDAAQWLYRILGIAFQGTADGAIVIRRCAFSDIYSGPVCRLISALDQGVLAGLAGGGQLTFQARLTEGAASCRACFDWEGERA